jgi:SMI1 / KNR4 family (SUKH-1)
MPAALLLVFSIFLREDQMSQGQYDALLASIRTHCQETAWDALCLEREQGWLMEQTDDYDGWYVPERQSFITLKKTGCGQEPTFAFPPIPENQLIETEQKLGFSLPPLLRLLYTHIANGGFGPGYGIIGVIGGFPLMDGFGEDIAQGYQQAIQAGTLIQLEAYEMITWAQWVRASDPLPDDHQEGETSSRSASNGTVNPDWEHIYLYEFPSHVWPERLLPLCYWGCAICTYIDARTEHIFQCTGGGQGYILRYVAASLEEWLERWLAGEALQFL